MEEVKTGDVFFAHNKYMIPKGKNKYHLCVSDNLYFLINTQCHAYNFTITPEDCSLLEYPSYINLTTIRTEPIKEFKIIKKEELSIDFIKKLIEKIRLVPSIPNIQKNNIINLLLGCIK